MSVSLHQTSPHRARCVHEGGYGYLHLSQELIGRDSIMIIHFKEYDVALWMFRVEVMRLIPDGIQAVIYDTSLEVL